MLSLPTINKLQITATTVTTPILVTTVGHCNVDGFITPLWIGRIMKISKCSYPVYFISIGKSLKFPTK